MQKGTLSNWGRAMMGIGLITLLKFVVATAAVPAAFFTIAEITSGETSSLPPIIQFALTLAGYMTVTAVVVVLLAGIFKAITYLLGLALLKLDDLIFNEKPIKIKLKGKIVELGERSEIYIEVNNRYWSLIKNVEPVVYSELAVTGGGYMTFQVPLKWRGIKDGQSSFMQIQGLKSKQIHLGTIKEDGLTMIHSRNHGSHLIDIGQDGLSFTITVSADISKLLDKKSRNYRVSIYHNNEKLHIKITDEQTNKIRHINETAKESK